MFPQKCTENSMAGKHRKIFKRKWQGKNTLSGRQLEFPGYNEEGDRAREIGECSEPPI